MIRSFRDMDRLASEKGPKRLVVLAPEDEEFMMAVREIAAKGYTRPVPQTTVYLMLPLCYTSRHAVYLGPRTPVLSGVIYGRNGLRSPSPLRGRG
jgi:hypothetical protein